MGLPACLADALRVPRLQQGPGKANEACWKNSTATTRLQRQAAAGGGAQGCAAPGGSAAAPGAIHFSSTCREPLAALSGSARLDLFAVLSVCIGVDCLLSVGGRTLRLKQSTAAASTHGMFLQLLASLFAVGAVLCSTAGVPRGLHVRGSCRQGVLRVHAAALQAPDAETCASGPCLPSV